MRKWNGSNWIRRNKRIAIYNRDNFRCVYCEKDLLDVDRRERTLDHLLAWELGGSNHEKNLVTCCKSCNYSKKDLPVFKFLEKLGEQGHEAKAIRRRINNAKRRKLDKTRAVDHATR